MSVCVYYVHAVCVCVCAYSNRHIITVGDGVHTVNELINTIILFFSPLFILDCESDNNAKLYTSHNV